MNFRKQRLPVSPQLCAAMLITGCLAQRTTLRVSRARKMEVGQETRPRGNRLGADVVDVAAGTTTCRGQRGGTRQATVCPLPLESSTVTRLG